MKYIQFDNSGELLTRYDSDIHGASIPEDSCEISDAIFWQTINEVDGVWKRDAGTDEISKHPFPAPTPTQIEAAKIAIVQQHMDAAARACRYDDMKTAVGYADEPAVPRFQNEGRALRAWRSLVWEKCYEILDEVNAETRAIPTDYELIAELPVLNLPTQ